MSTESDRIVRCAAWLDGLEPFPADTADGSLLALARLLLDGTEVPLAIEERRHGTMVLPALPKLAIASRARLLALLGRVARCARIRYPMQQHEAYAELFGALAIGVARDGDLTLTAALVRAAAQLHMTNNLLEIALEHLLAQQAEAGGFGLAAAAEAQSAHIEEAIHAKLRTTVDILLAWRTVLLR